MNASSSANPPILVRHSPAPRPSFFGVLPAMARNVWGHREMVRSLVARNLKIKYHQSVLGYLWSLIEPLVYMGAYYFIFVILAGHPEPIYPLLILLGVLTWRLFSSLVQDLTQTLVKNESLIKRVYFPREVLIFSSVIFHLTTYFLSLLVVVPFMAYHRLVPSFKLAILPWAVLLVTLLATGIGFVASCLHARARDTRELVTLMVRLGFWFSPAFYTLDRVPEAWHEIYLLNPLAVSFTLARSAVTGRPHGISFEHLALAVAVPVTVFVVGAALFRYGEAKAVKYL